jgi:hypothetical protein
MGRGGMGVRKWLDKDSVKSDGPLLLRTLRDGEKSSGECRFGLNLTVE